MAFATAAPRPENGIQHFAGKNINPIPLEKNTTNYHYKNPLPKLSHSETNTASQIYIALIDSQYKQNNFHCKLKKTWIDKILQTSVIDNVELFSNSSWTDSECNFLPFYIFSTDNNNNDNIKPKDLVFLNQNREYFNKLLFLKKPTYNPSSSIAFSILYNFLERSNADYLFIADDSIFIRTEQFIEYFKKVVVPNASERKKITGCCFELRDYFHMLLSSSGILISRDLVKKLLMLKDTWRVSISCELNSDEGMSHALIEIYLYLNSMGSFRFLGKPFSDYRKDMNILLNLSNKHKNEVIDYLKKAGLKKCPAFYKVKRSCCSSSFKMNEIVAWNGAQKGHEAEFVEFASLIFKGNNISEYVGVKWDEVHPDLCLYE